MKKQLLLAFAGLVLCSFYLWNNQKTNNFAGLVMVHGEIGYNFARSNSIKVNPERIRYVQKLQGERGEVVDYADIEHGKFGPPTEYRNVCDTIGYGILLGLLWKVTRSYRYQDVQILQLCMYLCMLFFLFGIVCTLFNSSSFAYGVCFFHLTFLPLVNQNAQMMRDIWAYYATIVLTYILVKMIYEKVRTLEVVAAGFFFAVCAHLRPTVMATLVGACIATLFIGWYRKKALNILKNLGSFWCMVILFFGVPFISYNKVAYDRWFVSPSGMWLVEGGIGAADNPWGYKLDDDWYAQFMKEKFGLVCGTVACEEKGIALYKQAFKEQPWVIIRGIFKQMYHVLFPYLPWITGWPLPDAYKISLQSWKEKLNRFLAYPSLGVLCNFMFLNWFQFVFMFLGYCGIVLMIMKRKYSAVCVLMSIVLSSYTVIFSHVEPRYIIPFYWPFSIFVSYALLVIVKGKLLGSKHTST